MIIVLRTAQLLEVGYIRGLRAAGYSMLYRMYRRIGGSVVECSPATRAARVRFPADAIIVFINMTK